MTKLLLTIAALVAVLIGLLLMLFGSAANLSAAVAGTLVYLGMACFAAMAIDLWQAIDFIMKK